jgi:hypothetical protein
VVAEVKKGLAEGMCAVIGLQSTGEARLQEVVEAVSARRRVNQALDLTPADDGSDGVINDEFASTPYAILESTVKNCFTLPPPPFAVVQEKWKEHELKGLGSDAEQAVKSLVFGFDRNIL